MDRRANRQVAGNALLFRSLLTLQLYYSATVDIPGIPGPNLDLVKYLCYPGVGAVLLGFADR